VSRKNKIARSDAPLNPKSFSQEMMLETTWNDRLTTVSEEAENQHA